MTAHFLLFLVLIGALLVEMLPNFCLIHYFITKYVFEHLAGDKPRIQIKKELWDEAQHAFDDPHYTVRFNLAPSYGKLTSKSIENIDEPLKIMIAGILEMRIQEQFNWKDLNLALDMNYYVKKQSRYTIKKIEKITFAHTRYVGQGDDGSTRLHSIRSWFSNLIGNGDILDDTDIDVDNLAKMVSQMSGKMINTLLHRKSKKMVLMDLGILRFPDISRPFFTIYRIHLIGSCHFHKFILHQEESSEILGLFQREVYYPDMKYIKKLKQDAIDDLLLEIDDLFKD